MTKRKVIRNGKSYVISYDDDLCIDYVTLNGYTEMLSSTNRDVRVFITHADDILGFKLVKGIVYAK